ncbi:MAG: RNA methyltransferase [Saprospiraceae bacterium]
MLSNNQSKLIRSLQLKKYRQKYRKFVVEGDKIVAEMLQQSRVSLDALYATDSWAHAHTSLLGPFADKLTIVTESELKKVSGLSTPNQVLAVANAPDEPGDFQTLLNAFTFYLDGIQDPGNLGTILRIADWFGFPAVLVSPDTVDAFNSKVIQASMGAVFRIPVIALEPASIRQHLPEMPLIGAVLEGQSIYSIDFPERGLLVIGNEGNGIRPATEALLSHRVFIPRGPGGQAESLNASVAAGILAAAVMGQKVD